MGHRDDPGSHCQPAVVPLDHDLAYAMGIPGTGGNCGGGGRRPRRAGERATGDVRKCRARRAGGLVNKRSFLLWLPCSVVAAAALGAAPTYPRVGAGRTLTFPRDHGAHPHYRTEWWYATGWLQTQPIAPHGLQLTSYHT